MEVDPWGKAVLRERFQKITQSWRGAYVVPVTDRDELDAVFLDQRGYVVLDPANVLWLASHLGKHDFGVIWRHTDLERGYVRVSPLEWIIQSIRTDRSCDDPY